MRLFLSIIVLAMLFGMGQGVVVNAQDVSEAESLIAYGEVVNGVLTPANLSTTFQFSGIAGDVIYFYILRENFDAYFYGQLFDADFQLIAQTESYPFAMNIILPSTDIYTLTIGTSEPIGGAFSFLIDFYTETEIMLDTEVTNRLPSPVHLGFYRIEAQAGQLFRYTANGNSLGISLFAPTGELASFQGTYNSPRLLLSQFEQTGRYTFVVNNAEPQGVNYSLFVESVTPIPLTASQPVSGVGTAFNNPVFVFESPSGKAWELNGQINNLESERRIFVAQLDERFWWDIVLASDSGSGANNDLRVSPFIAPVDGKYYVWLEFYPYNNSQTAYDYTVTLNSTSLISLAPDIDVTTTITPQTGAQTFLYTTTADDERVQIEIRRTTQTGAIAVNVYSPTDLILSVSGLEMNSAIFDLDLPLAGTYRFLVNDIGYDSNELGFTIRLRQLQNK